MEVPPLISSILFLDYPPPLPERKGYLHTTMKGDRPKQVQFFLSFD